MQPFNKKPSGRNWSLSVVVVMTLMAATTSGSCTRRTHGISLRPYAAMTHHLHSKDQNNGGRKGQG